MLTEFIQFKLIKSHPQLPKQPTSKFYDTKLSLQLQKRIHNVQSQTQKDLLLSKNSYQNRNVYTHKFQTQNNKNHAFSDILLSTNSSEYYSTQGNIQNLSCNSRSKIPLILSPKRLSLIRKQQTSLGRQTPLILSSCNKKSIKNKNQNLFVSSRKNEQKENTNIFAPVDSNRFIQSTKSNQEFIKSKQINLLQSLAQQNLSPIRQKLVLIRKNSNFQSQFKKQNSKKRNLNRSDSFKTAIEKSRGKIKLLKENIPPKSNIQIKSQQFNNQYYSKNRQNVRKVKENKSIYHVRQKLIRDPINRNLKASKQTKISKQFVSSFNEQMVKGNIHFQTNAVQQKVDSFIEQSVNNSNIHFLNQSQQKSLNMDPFLN